MEKDVVSFAVIRACTVDTYFRCSIHTQRSLNRFTAVNGEIILFVAVVVENKYPVGLAFGEIADTIHAFRTITACLSGELLDEVFLGERSRNGVRRSGLRSVRGIYLRCGFLLGIVFLTSGERKAQNETC